MISILVSIVKVFYIKNCMAIGTLTSEWGVGKEKATDNKVSGKMKNWSPAG